MEQRTDEWLQARVGHITGSRMADVISKIKTGESQTRLNYKTQLVTERLTNQPVQTYFNNAMQQGIDREPDARMLYELENKMDVEEVGFIKHPTLAWSGVSVDGLIGDKGIIEIKCPLETTHTNTLLKKQAPKKYYPQMQWGMCVTQRSFCDFVSYNPSFPDDLKLFVIRVERDDDYIKMLEEEVVKFNEEIEQLLNSIKEK
jgi:putative phage-type endonuclease